MFIGDDDAEKVNQEVLQRLNHIPSVYNAPDFCHELGYSGWSMVGDFNWRKGRDDKNVEDLQIFMDDVIIFPDPNTSTHEDGGCLDLVIFSNHYENSLIIFPMFSCLQVKGMY